MTTQELQRELKGLTRNYSVVQETPNSMSFYYTPKGCDCGGVAVIYDLPNNYEVALWEGLKEVRSIAEQGYHLHPGKRVKNKA